MTSRLWVLALGASLAGCASNDANVAEKDWGDYHGPDAGSASTFCSSAKDCPTGFTCEQNACRAPEVEKDDTVSNRPPAASPHYVYVLNPSADAVARVDPATLAIEAIPVPARPQDLVALSSEDVAIALSVDDPALTIIESGSLPSRSVHVPLARRAERLAVSPDGAWAVAFADPKAPLPDGAGGLVTLVDLKAARAGAGTKACYDRSAGFRVTDVLFRTVGGKATWGYVVAKETITLLDLANPAADVLPRQVRLPAAMAADVKSREVVATPDGAHVMLRSTVTPELAWFDGASLRTVPLPEVATDLDLVADGTTAIAALRAAGKLALLRIPEDLVDPTLAQLVTVTGGVGQVVVPQAAPASGNYALAWSNAGSDEFFVRVDLPAGTATVFPLQKRVDAIALAHDGSAAVVLHRADPASAVADEYERAVDQAQGYTVYDAKTGYLQLKTTGTALPGPFAFSPAGGYLGVALRHEAEKRYLLDVVDLRSLVPTALTLASAPLFLGPVPPAAGASLHRIFVSQDHPAGRISVVALDTRQQRTATGFTLNSEIE